MKLEKIGLQHQALLQELFYKLDVRLTEYSFDNAYLFRREHDFELIMTERLYLAGKTRDGHRFLMPIFRLKEAPLQELRVLLEDKEFLYPIPEDWLQDIPVDQIQKTTYEDADTDYWFSLPKIQNYPGRNLASKRNLVHQFTRNYVCEAIPLTENQREDAQQILDFWQSSMHETFTQTDYYPCQDALNNLSRLQLKGMMYYVDRKPVGFALGCHYIPEAFDLHFVKADKSYKGIYAFINQHFAQSLDETVKYINFEQDLGNPDLHHSKNSYQPDALLKKYRISL